MKIGITGAAGYLGSQLLYHFAPTETVVMVDRLMYGGVGLIPHVRRLDGQIITRDAGTEEAVKALQSCDVVIHLAAIVGEDACARLDGLYRYSNVEVTRRLAEALGPRLIFASTCSNYGIMPPGELATEDSPLTPLGRYARSKVEAEQIALDRGGLVLRFGTLFGSSPRMRFDLLVNQIARDCVYGRLVKIYAPTARRPWLHIDDACRTLTFMSTFPERPNAVFNVVGENLSKGELADLTLKLFPEARMEIVTEPNADSRDYAVSGDRYAKKFGSPGRVSVLTGLQEVADTARLLGSDRAFAPDTVNG